MTTEQKEAIETMQHWIEYAKIHKDKINKADELIGIQETVLNLIQEQEKELKRLDKEAQQYFETIIRQAQEFDSQLQKKDKIIRLMAEFIFQNVYVEEDICDRAYVECTQETAQDITCINCIKQYFERKVENDNFEE